MKLKTGASLFSVINFKTFGKHTGCFTWSKLTQKIIKCVRAASRYTMQYLSTNSTEVGLFSIQQLRK